MLVFAERRKPEQPAKNFSEQSREPRETTGRNGGTRVLSALGQNQLLIDLSLLVLFRNGRCWRQDDNMATNSTHKV